MNKLALAASFAAAMGTQGCDKGMEPVDHHADPVHQETRANPDIFFIQATLRLARERCIGGRIDNARRAFTDASRMRMDIENNLSPEEKVKLDAEIEITRLDIHSCLVTNTAGPQ